MKRTRNAVRNVIFGGLLKGYQILVSFIMRTLLIRYLGMEYLGLNSLFTSILQILNLAELGVGSALGYSMYAPIAEGKKDEICALLSLYRRYYRLIGLGIFLAGIVLLPFLPSLVKTDSIPPDVDLYVLYLLHLGACVISYWLFAYKNSLLAAHQRSDLANKADLAVRTLQYLIQAGLLVGFRNYYWYLLAALGAQILTNLCTALVAQKNYPDYVPKGQVEEQTRQKIRGKIKDLFTSRVGVVIVNSADTLVISAFLGLTVLAVYQNYYYIVTSVIGLVGVLFTSTLAGIGNSLLTESRGKNYADFCKFTLLPAVSVAALYETVDRRGRHFARTDRDLSVCILFYLRVQPAVQCLQGCRRDLAQRPVPDTDNGRSESGPESSAGETYGAVRSDPVYGSCYGHRRNAVADT